MQIHMRESNDRGTAALSGDEMDEAHGVLRLSAETQDPPRPWEVLARMPNGDPASIILWGADEG